VEGTGGAWKEKTPHVHRVTHCRSALKRDAIVHSVLDFLRAVEVARCSGQVLVPEQSLNLLQFAAGLAAELGARAALMPHAALPKLCRMPDYAE
jgi:hypothetical protein